MDDRRDREQRADFADFVASSSRQLLRAAWLLTGDWGQAEDLVQTGLAATWRRWTQLPPIEAPYAYTHRVLVTTFLRWNRRRWVRELDVLPARQRAVVVLRYFADLSEAQTAAAMGCAVGTVKSHSAKAVARLRAVPGLAEVLSGGVAP